MALQRAPRALLFDVFGTCVDWRRTVTHTLHEQAHVTLNSASASLPTSVRMRASSMTMEDWGKIAQEWRNSYKKFTRALSEDPSLPWKTVDDHHCESLIQLMIDSNLEGLWTEEELGTLAYVWHRLDPWPDSSQGIEELNKLCYTVTLSNGNLSLLDDLRVHAKMDFTHVFSAELFGSYKPSPKVYLGAVEKLGLKPDECVMVAAHLGDLKAAKLHGLQVIYVERPLEEDWDAEHIASARKEGWVDLWISQEQNGFIEMAAKLGIDVGTAMRRAQSEPV